MVGEGEETGAVEDLVVAEVIVAEVYIKAEGGLPGEVEEVEEGEAGEVA